MYLIYVLVECCLLFPYVCVVLNQFIQKIDGRLEKLRKPGATVNIKRERVEGSASTSRPPYNLPKWMIGPAFHSLLPIMDSMVGSEHSGSNHMEVTDPTVKPESIMSEHGKERYHPCILQS